MFVCPNGNVFIGSIDTTREQKDIKTIGIDNIVQIYINNVSSMRSVANLLICHFPSLYYQSYITHCLELLLEDAGKTTWAK
jgi:hypothetical protein